MTKQRTALQNCNKKKSKKKYKSIEDIWDTIKRPKIYVISLNWKERDAACKEIMAEKILKHMRIINHRFKKL